MKFIASCSMGKDSLAQCIIARERGEPIDGALYCEVMYTPEISAEIPEHRDFIYNVAIPRLEREYGIKTEIIRSEITMKDTFFHINTKGKNVGKVRGFPIPRRCIVNKECKIRAIDEWRKAQTEPIISYVGIAIDEPKRLERLNEGSVSLLAKYGITEAEAAEICKRHGLYSPIYEFSKRNGCWFCPNATKKQLLHIYHNHRDLWDDLLSLQDVPNQAYNYWARGETLYDVQKRLEAEPAPCHRCKKKESKK